MAVENSYESKCKMGRRDRNRCGIDGVAGGTVPTPKIDSIARQAASRWPSLASLPVNIDKDLSRPDAPDDEYIYWSN